MSYRKFPEAKVALCKCGNHDKVFGVRFERCSEGWKYTWAFPIKKLTVAGEYNSTNIMGDIVPGEEYPGCPYCGSKDFAICGDGHIGCGKLFCYHGEEWADCPWCGNGGYVGAFMGTGINACGDR